MVLGDNPDGLALKAESANLWYRCMGRINGKSLDVLRKEPGNSVDYTGAVKDCDSCPLGKSTQQPHPKQATYGVLRPFQLMTVDTLGPFQPQSLGGFRYATKFVDQKTKWKEIYLMKDKSHSVDSLALFNIVPCLEGGSTFARVCRLQSVRIFVAITVKYDWDMDHMDVSTAFLYADIHEKLFVEQAPGFVVKDKDGGELVMQLEKSLYGLAQSPGN